jgi:hypothetical protein
MRDPATGTTTDTCFLCVNAVGVIYLDAHGKCPVCQATPGGKRRQPGADRDLGAGQGREGAEGRGDRPRAVPPGSATVGVRGRGRPRTSAFPRGRTPRSGAVRDVGPVLAATLILAAALVVFACSRSVATGLELVAVVGLYLMTMELM